MRWVLRMASGRSRNSAAIAAGDLRWRSAFFEQHASGGIERRLVADAGEHIEQPPSRRPRVAHVVGGHQRDAEVPRDVDQRAVEPFLVRIEVALQVDVEAVGEEATDRRRIN